MQCTSTFEHQSMNPYSMDKVKTQRYLNANEMAAIHAERVLITPNAPAKPGKMYFEGIAWSLLWFLFRLSYGGNQKQPRRVSRQHSVDM